MSYIKKRFTQANIAGKIADFCVNREGFEEDTWGGEKCLRYAAYGSHYGVHMMIYENKIGYYVEYECGGEVNSGEVHYNSDDFDEFVVKYERVVDSLVTYLH